MLGGGGGGMFVGSENFHVLVNLSEYISLMLNGRMDIKCVPIGM